MTRPTPTVTVPVERWTDVITPAKLTDDQLNDAWKAPGREGEFWGMWDDKPHHLIYRLLGHIKALAAAPAAPQAAGVGEDDILRIVRSACLAYADGLNTGPVKTRPARRDQAVKDGVKEILKAIAPAEAGEDVNWKAEYEAVCAARISDRHKSQEIINERDQWIVELIHERDALRAQPQAREDAQPVGGEHE